MASCRKVSWPLKSRCSTCFTCSFNVNHKEKWLPNWGHWSYQTKPNNALTKCKSLTSVICFHRLILPKPVFIWSTLPKRCKISVSSAKQAKWKIEAARVQQDSVSEINWLLASLFTHHKVWILNWTSDIGRSSQRRFTSTTCTSLARRATVGINLCSLRYLNQPKKHKEGITVAATYSWTILNVFFSKEIMFWSFEKGKKLQRWVLELCL